MGRRLKTIHKNESDESVPGPGLMKVMKCAMFPATGGSPLYCRQ